GDESADDFSFRKCVDHILPLPEAMRVKHDANRALGKRGGGGKGRSRGGKGKVNTLSKSMVGYKTLVMLQHPQASQFR
ncbi:hypothetical protein RYX36_006963, partial [Vicia faba]